MGFNTYPNNPWPLSSDKTGSGGGAYELPIASAETLGGVKVGSGLSIVDGVLSAKGFPDYSTDEQIICKWVDNSDIYQKTFAFDTTTGDDITVDLSALNIDRLIDTELSLGDSIYTGVDIQIAGGSGYYNGGGDSLNCYYDNATGYFHIRSGSNFYKTTNGYATIRYTKTATP